MRMKTEASENGESSQIGFIQEEQFPMDEFRRTESARNLLVSLIKQLEASSKKMMFRYIQQVHTS